MKTEWTAIAVMLTLALLVLASGTRRSPSAGFMLDVATAPESCGDGRDIVASALGHQRVTLHFDQGFDIRELPSKLRTELSSRAEKLVYVTAEPGASFGEFLQLVDAVRPEAEIISLITPQVEVLASARFCLAPSCGPCDDLRSSRLKRSID